MIQTCLFITDYSLPVEELYRLWDLGYEVWVVSKELERQLKPHWAIMQEDPWTDRRMKPKLIAIDM